jgi:hypothetical protein
MTNMMRLARLLIALVGFSRLAIRAHGEFELRSRRARAESAYHAVYVCTTRHSPATGARAAVCVGAPSPAANADTLAPAISACALRLLQHASSRAAAAAYVQCASLASPYWAAIGAYSVYGLDVDRQWQGYDDGTTDCKFAAWTFTSTNGAAVAVVNVAYTAITCANLLTLTAANFGVNTSVAYADGVSYVLKSNLGQYVVVAHKPGEHPGSFYQLYVTLGATGEPCTAC